MNIKILKIILIIAFILISIVEALYLWALPSALNAVLKTSRTSDFLKQKTGLILSYENARIKTFPAFSSNLSLKNLKLIDSDNNLVASANSIDASVSLPHLLLKRLKIKTFEANNFNLTVSRQNDKKFSRICL